MSNQQPQQPEWAGQPQQPYSYGPYGQPPFQPQPPKKGPGAGKIIGIGCASVLGLAVVIGIAAAVGSNSSDSVTSTPASRAAAHSSTAGKKASPAKKPEAAKTGDTISVSGYENGSKLDVTVVKIADPGKPADEYTEADPGKRFVGVQFRLVNTGSAVYSDSPSNGAQITDTKGQQFETEFADITAGPSMASAVKLKPGATALGWIVFEVPKASKLATVQFTMDSGFADQTGEWKLS
ncbi:DUF4352 domain-containing protein [Streptomyces sp. NPDC004237]|uniref:DUF4352 domain-containing protein n=1 Tax=Streptomyces sp. NPDC004237 TaxID=3154455 RepID=UPI00339F200C